MLRTAAANSQLLKDGYAILEVSQSGLVGKLLDVFNETCPEAGASSSFYYSLMKDGRTNLLLKERLSRIMTDEYRLWFRNFEVTVESFLCKPARFDEPMHLHQDWNHVDEQMFWSLNIWMPLVDVDENSGCIFVIPGSHGWFSGFRSGSYPTPRIPAHPSHSERIISLPMRRGQALVFHPALLHGSFPNRSAKARPVMGAIARTAGSPITFPRALNAQTAEIYTISEATLLTELPLLNRGDIPISGKLDKVKPYVRRPFSSEDIVLRHQDSQF